MKRMLCLLMLYCALPGLRIAQASEAPVTAVQSWQATGKAWEQPEADALARALLGPGEATRNSNATSTSQEYTLTNAQGATLRFSPSCFTYRHHLIDDYDLAAYSSWDAGQWHAREPVNLDDVPPLDGLDITQAMALVMDALEPLGLSLGAPAEVQAWDTAALVRSAEAWYGINHDLSADAAALSPCYRLMFPVYFEGCRLGPGVVTGPQGDICLTAHSMVCALVDREGIVELVADNLLLENPFPLDAPRPALDAEAALALYRQSPREGDPPEVEKMLLQYLYAWQQRPGVLQYTYTLRPVWYLYTTWEEEVEYAGLPPLSAPYGQVVLDAVTGELLDL